MKGENGFIMKTKVARQEAEITSHIEQLDLEQIELTTKLQRKITTTTWYDSGVIRWNVYPTDTGGSGINNSATRFMMVKGQQGYVGHNPNNYHRPWADLDTGYNGLGILASRGQWCTLHMLLQDYAGNYFEVNSQSNGQ